MDTKQAKFILHSWRANGADARDPQFAEALREIERDPELAEWFAQEQALDAAIGAKLRAVTVPGSLRETILAARTVKEIPIARRRLAPLALAAAIAVLATLSALGFLFANRAGGFSSYRTRMVKNLSGLQLDFTASRLPEVQGWLAANRQISGYNVPDGLQQRPSIGCKYWSWRGKPVALICFSLDDGRAAHLFIVPRSALPDAPGAGQPQFAPRQEWMTASWSEGDFVYVVARRGDEASLRQLLGFKA